MNVRIRNARLSPREFEISERTGRARLIETIYTLVPPAGMEFDEGAVRTIRSQWDPGFIPFHRKMIYRAADGGVIVCHNWGVCRYSEKGTQNEMLKTAQKPMTGYFSKLETPTDVDGIFPFGVGMDNAGLPAPYQPFYGPMVMDLCRRVYGEALAKFMERTEDRAKSKEGFIDKLIDEADQHFADLIPRSDWSTAVAPTPRAKQIQPTGEMNAQP